MNCSHMIAPTGTAHRDAGAYTFCLKCSTFFAEDGSVVTLAPMAVRNCLADRINTANAKFHSGNSDHLTRLEGVIRNGGMLN